MPNWPVNDKPQPAKVDWDSHGLKIEAANSSLMQILSDVSTATGAKVEGLNRDERVFGTYGPGPARDVLTQLLQGSDYNIMVLGSADSKKPLQVLLTPRTGTTSVSYPPPSPVASNATEPEPNEPAQEEPTEPAPPPNAPAPGFAQPNQPARTPQEILQQIQRRQMQNQGAQPPQNQ